MTRLADKGHDCTQDKIVSTSQRCPHSCRARRGSWQRACKEAASRSHSTISMSSLFVPPATLRDVPRSDAADAYPKDHSALVVPASDNAPAYEMSYAALAATVTAVGKQLMSLLPTGKEEQVVALAMPNTLAFPLGFLGAAWGGAATAPLNPDYKEEEFRFYLEDNNVDLLLVSVEGNPNAEAAAAALSVPVYRLTINPSPAAEAAGSLTWVSGPGPKQ
ncbi:hypothetical protein VYU27_009640, partial [Nannochloropsis oceanica]